MKHATQFYPSATEFQVILASKSQNDLVERDSKDDQEAAYTVGPNDSKPVFIRPITTSNLTMNASEVQIRRSKERFSKGGNGPNDASTTLTRETPAGAVRIPHDVKKISEMIVQSHSFLNDGHSYMHQKQSISTQSNVNIMSRGNLQKNVGSAVPAFHMT